MKQFFIYLYLLLLFTISSSGQSLNTGTFHVTHVSHKIAVDIPGIKDKLNKEILKAHTSQEVFAIINKNLTGYVNEKVSVIQLLANNRYQLLDYKISAPEPTSENIIDIKASRALLDPTYLKDSTEANIFFKGKIAIWDALKVRAYTKVNLLNLHFFIQTSTGDRITFLPTVAKKNQLIFDRSALAQYDIAGNKIELHLYDHSDSSTTANNLVLYFLTPEDKDELKGFYQVIKKQYAGTPYDNEANISALLQAYSKTIWGNLPDDKITEHLLIIQ